MRPLLFLAVLSSLLVVSCQSNPGPLDQERKNAIIREVEETLSGLTQAMNSQEAEEVLGYFRESEEFLYLGCTDYLMGWEAFSRRVGFYYEANPEVEFHQEILRVQVLSPTVVVAALTGGSTKAEALFWTEVLVREADGWKIAHEHESWPGCPAPSSPHPFTVPGEMPEDVSGLVGDTSG